MILMPNCQQITEQASDYLERNQSPWRRAAFRMHLLMCRYCRRHLKHLDLTVSTLGRIARERDQRESGRGTDHIQAMIRRQLAEDERRRKGGDSG